MITHIVNVDLCGTSWTSSGILKKVSVSSSVSVRLDGVLLQGELLSVVSPPEEPLLVVEVRSEFPRPGRGVLYSGAVTSLPAWRKIHRLSLVAGHLRHPGDDRPQGQLQAGQVAD